MPKVLLAGDISTDNRLSDECDCACADDGMGMSWAGATGDLWRQAAFLHRQELPDNHTLLFNSLYDGGIAVLNQPARRLWQAFDAPRQPADFSPAEQEAVQKMITSGLLQPAGAQSRIRRGQPQTLSAWLHVTNDCNLRCDYCYVPKTADAMPEEVGYAAVDAVFRAAHRNNFQQVRLKFAGGEATLNLKLVFILANYARERAQKEALGLEMVLLSNGVALGEKAIARLKAQEFRVMISLDGVGRWHDAQRHFINGRGSFAWVDRTITRLLDYGVEPFISITISDRNVAGLPDVVAYVLERDLPFNLNFFRDNDCATPFADLQLQEERLIAALNDAFDLIEEKVPRRSLLGALVDRAQFHQPHDRTCGVGESYMVIDHQGQVGKCHMTLDQPVTTVDAEDPLQLIRLDVVGVQNVAVTEKDGCRVCEWRFWCAGGCPIVTYRATGRYDVKSPYCRVYKTIYPRLLRLEGLRLLQLQRPA